MSDGSESLSPTTPIAPITTGRATTADDLLEMYDQEASSGDDGGAEETPTLPGRTEAKPVEKPLNEEGQDANGEETQGTETTEVFKAKVGDADVDIPQEATITQKIGNKDVSFKVADAVKAFVNQETFNRNMDRRIQAATQKETSIKNEYKSIQQKAGNLARLARQGEWLPVVKSLAKMAVGNSDLDPVEFEKACLDSLDGIRELYSKKTPQERELYFAKRRAEAASEEAKTLRESSTRNEAIAEITREIDQLCESHAVPQDRFFKYFEVLRANEVGQGRRFANEGEIQPQHVITFANDVRHIGKISDAIARVDESLSSDDDFCREVFNLTKDRQEFTVEDLEKIIRGALSQNSTSIENLNRKVQNANSRGLRTQNAQGSSKGPKSEIDDALEEEFLGHSKRMAQVAHLRR